MSREEAEYLVERIKNGIGSSSATLRDCAKESLDKLVEMATIPTRYTPREEVTEGWYFARMVRSPLSDREAVKCIGDDLLRVADRSRWEITDFTDFLPVPAWCVEGVGKQPK